MSKTILVFLVGLLLVIMPSIVSADISFDESKIDFGDDDQEKFDDNGDSEVLNEEITITSDKNYTNVVIRYEADGGIDVSGDIVLGSVPGEMNDEYSAQVDIDLTIPEDFDAVDDNLDKTDFDIGKIVIEGEEIETGETHQDEISLTLEVKNEIEIDKIEIERDDVDEITSSSTVEIDAEDNVEFIFYIKNLFHITKSRDN